MVTIAHGLWLKQPWEISSIIHMLTGNIIEQKWNNILTLKPSNDWQGFINTHTHTLGMESWIILNIWWGTCTLLDWCFLRSITMRTHYIIYIESSELSLVNSIHPRATTVLALLVSEPPEILDQETFQDGHIDFKISRWTLKPRSKDGITIP